MGDSCLLDFEEKGEDDFSNLEFESEVIKMVDFEVEDKDYEIWGAKRILRTKRVPKKDKLLFFFIEEIVGERSCWKGWDLNEVVHEESFAKEQDARDRFNGEIAYLEFLSEKNKEGKVFDGRRYMWEVKDDKLTGKRGWD